EQGVFITTPGVFRVKSNEKVMEGGEGVGYEVVRLPKSYSLRFHFTDDDGIPYPNTEYEAINKDTGETLIGVTDNEGFTEYFYSDKPNQIEVYLHI
ncbi:hypothetical protein, partial [Moraxella lacunata]|uniref:hypothetical protein n=1 Tax=Moraxella lacunata TaxID=477 RepID=UPI0024ACAE7F